MELIGILRVLWIRRTFVGLGALAALAVGFLVMRGAPAPTATWVASARVLVDTPDSQLVNPAPKAVDTLPMRAELTADFLASDEQKAQVARLAGVPAAQLDVLAPAMRAEPPVVDELVDQAIKFAATTTAPYVLSVYADGLSPIIAIEANASDPTRAQRLANAAMSILRADLSPAGEQSHAFVTETVAPLKATKLVHGSHRAVFAAVGAIAIFALWCAGILLTTGIARRSRRVRTA